MFIHEIDSISFNLLQFTRCLCVGSLHINNKVKTLSQQLIPYMSSTANQYYYITGGRATRGPDFTRGVFVGLIWSCRIVPAGYFSCSINLILWQTWTVVTVSDSGVLRNPESYIAECCKSSTTVLLLIPSYSCHSHALNYDIWKCWKYENLWNLIYKRKERKIKRV